MMTSAGLLVVLCLTSADGGSDAGSAASDAGTVSSVIDAGAQPLVPNFKDPLYSSCPADPAEDDIQLDGGSWLAPDLRVRRNACLMATCDVRRQELVLAPPELAAPAYLVGSVALAVGLVLGLVFGVYVGWGWFHH